MHPEELLAHADFVHTLARRLVLDEHRAADLEQDTWLAALKNRDLTIRSPRAWLTRVIRNLAATLYRQDSRRKKHEQSAAQSGPLPSPEILIARGEARQRLIEAVLGLVDPYRSVLLLRFYEDLSARQIAREQGIPLETVRTRIKKGLEKLKVRLDDLHGGNRGAWCMALAPLAGLKLGATATASAGTASLLSGVIVMSTKVKAALVAAIVVGIGLSVYIPLNNGFFKEATPNAPESTRSSPLEKMEYAGPSRDEDNLSKGRVPIEAPSGRVLIRGTVSDSTGRPAEGASVRVFWMDDTRDDARTFTIDGVAGSFNAGSIVDSGADGRFEICFNEPTQCYVYLSASGSFLHEPDLNPEAGGGKWQGRWVDAPEDGVDFTIHPKPTARVILQVVEAETGARLSGFDCTFWSRETKNYNPGRAEGEILEKVLPVHKGQEAGFTVSVYHPAVPKDLRKSFSLNTGEIKEAVVSYPRKETWKIRGKVVDATGVAVKDALVFFGALSAGRGDEPFKPFVPKRIQSGVRTDANGIYVLEGGRGDTITAWHELHGSATVRVNEADSIQLPPRGTIDGTLLDLAGRPRPGVEIVLDRLRKTITEEWGHFTFEGVEPGIRGLCMPGKKYAAVNVPAGKTVRADLGGFLPEVRVELYAEGRPYREPCRGVVVGLDSLFTVHEAKAEEGALLLREILPGAYLLLTDTGLQVEIAIEAGLAIAELGGADLTVRAEEGTRVYVVPEGAHELIDLLSCRVAPKAVPASGEVRFGPIDAGRYAVGIDGKGLSASVEVIGPGATVRIQ